MRSGGDISVFQSRRERARAFPPSTTAHAKPRLFAFERVVFSFGRFHKHFSQRAARNSRNRVSVSQVTILTGRFRYLIDFSPTGIRVYLHAFLRSNLRECQCYDGTNIRDLLTFNGQFAFERCVHSREFLSRFQLGNGAYFVKCVYQ